MEPTSTDTTSPLSDNDMETLFRLAQLEMPTDSQAREALRRDLHQLDQFVEHINDCSTENVIPLTHLWPDNTSLDVRQDIPMADSSLLRGRQLLRAAHKTQGNFYTVEKSSHST